MIDKIDNVENMKKLELENFQSTQDPVVADCDTCTKEEISSLFNSKCTLIAEESMGANEYILHVSGSLESCPNVVIGLSDNTTETYKLENNSLVKLGSYDVSDFVIGVKVCSDNSDLFYVGTNDGVISLFDMRASTKAVSIFKDTSIENGKEFKPLTCFDISANNRLLAGGTELYGGDAFLLFWDVRNVKLLGGYWESHTDDITQVKFHSDDVNKVMSGSTDGLINVYDLSQASEDDALLDSLNTESSVDQLCWFDRSSISCVLHTNDVQLWKSEDAEPFAYFHRQELSRQIKREATDYCYIADAYTSNSGNIYFLVGSTDEDGRCLRCLGVNKNVLLPSFNFNGNKQIVRCSWFNKYTNILVTGGEKSIMNVWDIDRNVS